MCPGEPFSEHLSVRTAALDIKEFKTNMELSLTGNFGFVFASSKSQTLWRNLYIIWFLPTIILK